MGKCERCGREVENFVTIRGQKLCTECVVQTQKDIDPDSLNYSACT
jgi:NMD protein affecting ribosome stability and mRNA decay